MRSGTLGLALLAAAWAAASVPVLAQEAGAGEVEIFLVGSKSPGADASFHHGSLF